MSLKKFWKFVSEKGYVNPTLYVRHGHQSGWVGTEQADSHIDGQTDKQQTDGQTVRQTDKQMDQNKEGRSKYTL